MLTAAVATLTLATLATPAQGCLRGAHAAHHAAGGSSRHRPGPRAALVSRAGDLYSSRAKRRMASYLRIRLLELREEGLDRAAAVIERRLPVDMLLQRSP